MDLTSDISGLRATLPNILTRGTGRRILFDLVKVTQLLILQELYQRYFSGAFWFGTTTVFM